VRDDKVKQLGVEHVVGVKHHLSEQPVISRVEWRVGQIRVDICANCQMQEVARFGINVEVGAAGNRVTLDYSGKLVVFLVRVVDDEES
jgi:hypothetical protein